MNGFLVVVRHTMDDLPVALLPNRDLALGAASTVDPMAPELQKLLNTDASTPTCVNVIEYKDGWPVNVETVRDFDGRLVTGKVG